MNDGTRSIRREIARHQHGRRPRTIRYPKALRERVVALALRRRARGARIAVIARDLGLAPWTLNLWLRKRSAPVLRAVEIVPAASAPAPTTPVLMTPRGLRVEGAPLDVLVTLLRALG
jgi:transposase-like protein